MELCEVVETEPYDSQCSLVPLLEAKCTILSDQLGKKNVLAMICLGQRITDMTCGQRTHSHRGPGCLPVNPSPWPQTLQASKPQFPLTYRSRACNLISKVPSTSKLLAIVLRFDGVLFVCSESWGAPPPFEHIVRISQGHLDATFMNSATSAGHLLCCLLNLFLQVNSLYL